MGKRKSNRARIHKMSSTSKDVEVFKIRRLLLKWYDVHRRDLPWRAAVGLSDANLRAYSVWVSEIMLQQTQVTTVIDYYERWMAKWPTVGHLSSSCLEEVHQVWSGLGYYSRAKRLHEAAQQVVNKLKGHIPRTSSDLQRLLPGVGRYTSCAIASIAFSEVVGVVDGNVIRVLTRLRTVGAVATQREAQDWLWSSVNVLVDPKRPGDFNQALMELGATMCTPKGPNCSACPLQENCQAYKQASGNLTKSRNNTNDHTTNVDIEEAHRSCSLCPPEGAYDSSAGVENYPKKAKKKSPKVESVAVVVAHRSDSSEFLLVQRPDQGLLASLWEFPNVEVLHDSSEQDKILKLTDHLKAHFVAPSVAALHFTFHGEVLHVFSHIKRTYCVFALKYNDPIQSIQRQQRPHRWMREVELKTSAISTAMKKVFRTFHCSRTVHSNKRKPADDSNQSGASKRKHN